MEAPVADVAGGGPTGALAADGAGFVDAPIDNAARRLAPVQVTDDPSTTSAGLTRRHSTVTVEVGDKPTAPRLTAVAH